MKTVLPLILLFVAAVTVEAGLSSRRAARLNCAGMQMRSCAGANIRGVYRETRASRAVKRQERRAKASCAGMAKEAKSVTEDAVLLLRPRRQVQCANGVCLIK